MLSHSPNPQQKDLLHPNLLEQINPNHPLVQLAQTLPWDYFEQEFSVLYSTKGKPAKPIRLMVGLSILKHVENLSDEELMSRWVQNPYYQAFCGETIFQWQFPCDSSDMTYFRKRIGKEGFEKIFAVSIKLHGEKAQEKDIHVDTTVQEKNVTFPTDDKLALKIINKTLALAKTHDIKLRRSYTKEIKAKKLALRFRQHPKNQRKAHKATKRLKTIAGILLREIARKLPQEVLQNTQLQRELYWQVLQQKRQDKHKIYSLHEPHIYCMAKGKLHKRYEFGTKVSIAKTTTSNIIVGAVAFEKNTYDGHTLDAALTQVKNVAEVVPESAWVDRGYRGRQRVNDTQIFYPKTLSKNISEKFIAHMKRQCRKRAGIEGVIGHLKADHRLGRNFLKGMVGDAINVLMCVIHRHRFNFLTVISN